MASKDIGQTILINDPFKVEYQPNGNYIMHYEEQIVACSVKEINDFIIKQLYKTYKDTPVSRVFVIDMKNFEMFLRRYLPIYLEEVRKCQN